MQRLIAERRETLIAPVLEAAAEVSAAIQRQLPVP
jgi:hypothetical protein